MILTLIDESVLVIIRPLNSEVGSVTLILESVEDGTDRGFELTNLAI